MVVRGFAKDVVVNAHGLVHQLRVLPGQAREVLDISDCNADSDLRESRQDRPESVEVFVSAVDSTPRLCTATNI